MSVIKLWKPIQKIKRAIKVSLMIRGIPRQLKIVSDKSVLPNGAKIKQLLDKNGLPKKFYGASFNKGKNTVNITWRAVKGRVLLVSITKGPTKKGEITNTNIYFDRKARPKMVKKIKTDSLGNIIKEESYNP